jgi:iron complex outermembrane receptor protein
MPRKQKQVRNTFYLLLILARILHRSAFQFIEGVPMENRSPIKARMRGANVFSRTKLCAGLVVAFGGLAIAPGVALAQDVKLERVEVTGSSIKRIEGASALPVTVYRREDIDRSGAATVADLVEKITANNGQGYQLSAALGDAARPGFSGASMRALGSNNTLILLNGRRLAVYAFDGGAVSLNDIPLSVIDRIEILRDGASSVYGTDAVAGVINLITRSDFKGGEVAASMDTPRQAGGKIKQMRATFGYGDVGSDRFNVFANVSRTTGDSIAAKDREFSKTSFLPEFGINKTSSNSFPASVSIPGVGLRSPLAPFYVKPAGSPATPGALPAGSAAPGNIPGGSTYGCVPPVSFGANDAGKACRFDYASVIDIIPESSRDNIFLRGTVQLPGNHKLSSEYAASSGKYRFGISPSPISEATTLNGDPVLLPASSAFYPTAWLQTNFPTVVGQPLNLYYRGVETGPRTNEVKTDQSRFVIDLQGEIAGWDYSAGYMSAQSKATESYVGGYMSEARTIAAFATGKVNPFGYNTGEGLALLQAAQVLEDTRTAQADLSILNFKASREVMQLPAGPLGFAVGYEGRREKYRDDPKEVLNTGDIIGGGGTQLPVAGDRQVNAAFIEFNVPIIKSVESQLSVRHDRYNDFGNTTNPKLAIRWQPSKEFLVRSSLGTGFRAPALPDIFSQLSQTNTGNAYNDPLYDRNRANGSVLGCDNIFDGRYCGAQLEVHQGGSNAGGVTLLPEKSKNFTLGFLVEPTRDLSFGIDAFRIHQRDLIGINSPDAILESYIAGFDAVTGTSSSPYASKVITKFDPSVGVNVIDYVLVTFDNFGEQITQGADITLKWRLPKMEFANFRLNWDATFIQSQRSRDKGQADFGDNIVGTFARNGAVLRWKHRVEFIGEKGPWEGSVAWNGQSGYEDHHVANAFTGEPMPIRQVAAYATYDLQGKYTGIKNLTLTAGVSNLFDTAPPFSQQGLYFQVGYDPANTNPRGRALALGAMYKF